MMKVKIITPYGLYGEYEVEKIHCTTTGGECTLLPNHMPLVAMLATSKMLLTINQEERVYAVAGGLLQLNNNEVRVLADAFEGKDEIDVERAQRAKERAEMRLQRKDANTSIRRAQVALNKAINRIQVASHK